MCWALASLPLSTRSWSWLPSRPSEPRSSKCTAAVCRSNKQSAHPVSHCCCRHTHTCRWMMWWRKGGEGSPSMKERRADLSANCTPPSTPPSHISSWLPWFLTSFFSMNPLRKQWSCCDWGGKQRSDVTWLLCDLCLHFDLNNCVSSNSLVPDQCVRTIAAGHALPEADLRAAQTNNAANMPVLDKRSKKHLHFRWNFPLPQQWSTKNKTSSTLGTI